MSKYKSVLVLAALTAAGNPAQAAESVGLSLPNVAAPVSFGRLVSFASPKSTSWFLPAAFSPVLECEGGARTKGCHLRVMNLLSESEKSAVREATNKTGRMVQGFGDVYKPQIVTSIDERFEDLDPALAGGKQMILQSLAQSGTMPYAQVAFRTSAADAARLAERFRTEGLGTFVSETSFRAERVVAYLELRNAEALRALAARSLDAPVSVADLRAVLKAAVAQGDLVTNPGAEDDGSAMALGMLLSRWFRPADRGGLTIDAERLRGMTDHLVLLDLSTEPAVYRCRATLALKEGAVPKIECTDGGAR